MYGRRFKTKGLHTQKNNQGMCEVPPTGSHLPPIKGQKHEIFVFRVFSVNQFAPDTEYALRAVSIFYGKSLRYPQLNIVTGVSENSDKFIAVVVDAGNQP
jgi:hypothetical protein